MRNQSGSLNQGAANATTSSGSILKTAHLLAIFKRKMAVVSRKHLENTHRLGGSSHLPLPVSLLCFSSVYNLLLPFFLKRYIFFLAELALAVVALIDLKIQLCFREFCIQVDAVCQHGKCKK